MKFSTGILFLCTSSVHAFTISNGNGVGNKGYTRPFILKSVSPHQCSSSSPSSSMLHAAASLEDIDRLGLTPQLDQMTRAFGSIPDEKLRYKQLLYMANQLKPLDPDLMVPENKVPGCLSTVYVDCTPEKKINEATGEEENVLNYVGDSDGLLTKGLVALLVRGLSGCTAEQILKVDPEFISAARITQSLTPGRNNGFINMLAVMKAKAAEYAAASESNNNTKADPNNNAAQEESSFITSFDKVDGKPMYNEMMASLLKLKPVKLHLDDGSAQHAGHAGSKGWEESGESHFNLTIVAEVFGSMSAVKRHKLIYLVLGDTMQKIHALQITAKAPDEVADEE